VTNCLAQSLSSGRKFMLAIATTAVVAAPLLVGIESAPFGFARPQADSHPAAFEAASIKPAAIPVEHEGGNRSRIEYSPNSLTMRNVALGDCVQWAYSIAPFQISGQNLSSDSYDIFARAGAPVTVSQLKAMLQDLLANRFRLALHREQKMLPAYELVIAKGGPKLPAPNAGASIHAAESLPRVQGDSFVFYSRMLP
jgi:uncharacterized protein (TIGR03435 family)